MTTDPRPLRRAAALALGALLALGTLPGCGDPALSDVTGTVTIDGQPPAMDGASITFVPTGKTAGGGAAIKDGKYAVKLAPGGYKVEVRAPRPLKGGKATKAGGPGPGGVADIEESLPAKYNDKTELTYEVKAGKQEKNWELAK